MTTLRELIKNICKIEKNEANVEWGNLRDIFGLEDIDWCDDTQLKAYWLKELLDSNETIGISVYYLNNEFVGICTYTCRKDRGSFEFVSTEAANKVELYLFSLREKKEIKILNCLDVEIESKFKVEYAQQIAHSKGWYKNQKVQILRPILTYPVVSEVKIILNTEERIKIPVEEVSFDYNTI